MKNKKLLLYLIITLLLIVGCKPASKNLEIFFLKDGDLRSENIILDFINKEGNIYSPYIDTVKFSYLDSLAFPEMHPDYGKLFTTPKALDFNQKITLHSPEYYCASTVYHIIRVFEYYNCIFENKIDFNSQETYKTIEVTIGDVPLFTQPNTYIYMKNSNPSPSIIAHEIGHRAFWYLEDELGVKFDGFTIIHMGLLEYFTVSFNNSPLVGEDGTLANLVRNADLLCKYPLDSSFKLRTTFRLLEEAFSEEIRNPQSNISKYLTACYATYDDYILDNIEDNHRGGMVLTSTLWRIRKQIGREKTDKLVAQTILHLNDFLDKRPEFYLSQETPPQDKIEWYDVFYGLIRKDKEFYKGQNIEIIINEFARTEYPIEILKIE